MNGTLARSIVVFIIGVLCAVVPSAAQQQPPPGQSGTPVQSDTPGESGTQQSGTSDHRLFGTLPDFLTVQDADNVPPLTAREKFDVTIRSSFDWGQYLFYGGISAISQATNADPSFGQGALGYGKRYALAAVDGTIENFFTTALFPAPLHQDPRYYRLGEGGLVHRSGYAVSRIFVTRGDNRHIQFNISELGGSGISAALYNTYHPASDRSVSNTLESWWMQVGYDTIFIMIREFWPDVQAKLHRHRGEAPPGS
jgi:hypothetical protein